jgi:23S rRNA (cytidine2498-2'-O)-methyltransferase
MQEPERSEPKPAKSPEPSTQGAEARPWLIRIDVNFESLADEVLNSFGAISCARLGEEYYLIKTYIPEAVRESTAAQFARWNMPVEHSWPCNPARMDGFIEKAAQAMWKKFGPRKPQSILMGPLVPGSRDPYYKDLASNLRGRTLQLFPPSKVKLVEDQAVDAPTLFALVGREGLFCGMQSPRACNGFYPGGSRFISLSSPGTISRAGGKIAEALHYLRLYRPALPEDSHWLELGACPGGMTSELLAKGFRVTAIDRAVLDKRVLKYPGLEFIHADVLEFTPPNGVSYDAILCDMNGPPHEAMQQVVRLAKSLRRSGLVVFTLKFSRVERVQDPLTLFKNLVKLASEGGLKLFAQTHLTYNGHEFTMFLEKGRPS